MTMSNRAPNRRHTKFQRRRYDLYPLILQERSKEMITFGGKREIMAYLRKRRDELIAWLRKEDPACFTQQKHLQPNSGERVYWHYGYLSAVRDTLQLLSQKSVKALRS